MEPLNRQTSVVFEKLLDDDFAGRGKISLRDFFIKVHLKLCRKPFRTIISAGFSIC